MLVNKKICWITSSYMLQVDLPVLAALSKHFVIDWYFWGEKTSSTGELALEYANKNGIKITFNNFPSWLFHPIAFIRQQSKMIKELRDMNYSLFYFDTSTFPWLLFIIKKNLPFNRVVIAMHHGKPHKGMRFKPIYFPFLKLLNRQDCNLQYFSKTQAEAFKGPDINRRYIIPLALNDFGEIKSEPKKDIVTFTFFGNIIPSKNLPLLIKATDKLWQSCPNRFKIKIVGHCRNWSSLYAPLIQNHEAFELDIRRVEESDIPVIFGETNYLVLPYSAVTQSGPLRIAYGYNVPVIASNLDGFKESVIDGTTGILFKTEDVNSLSSVMEEVIKNHPYAYEDLKKTQKDYVDTKLSVDSICKLYSKMFNEIIDHQ